MPNIVREENEFLTTTEVAQMLRTWPQTVACWIRSGRLKGYRAGRKWLVKKADLEQFIAVPR